VVAERGLHSFLAIWLSGRSMKFSELVPLPERMLDCRTSKSERF
jgi:hypothetical protein